MDKDADDGHRSMDRVPTVGILRVAIATDGPILAWQARLIDLLADVPGVEIAAWDRVSPTSPGLTMDAGSGARRIVAIPHHLAVLSGAPRTDVDVAIDLTTRPPMSMGPDETWYFTYGEADIRDAPRAALVDYIVTPGTTRVTLRVGPDGKVLREGLLTCRREEQLERMLLDPSGWPAGEAARRLAGSSRLDAPGIDPGTETAREASRASGRTSEVPMAVLKVAAMGRRGLRMKDALTKHDDWNVGVISAPIGQVVHDGATQPIAWFGLRPDRFAADPFGIERDGTFHVFFEDYDQLEGRGTIAHVAMSPDGVWTEPTTVLDPGVHTSYPFLIEDGGSIFMLPETSAANELVLYEATDFPRGWTRAATLLESIPVVDASVVPFQDRWWMFGTVANLGAAHNLFLWHAPTLMGPWTPHGRNPVKTDARSARPGGTPFFMDGRLYRPSQDCSTTYGGGITVCRVDSLTIDDFVETPIRWLGPRSGSPQPDGFHTLSSAGSRTLVDGKTRHLVKGVLQRTMRGRAAHVVRRLHVG